MKKLILLFVSALFGLATWNAAAIDFSFQPSLQAGAKDVNGKVIHGTELMQMVPFNGKLYAGNDLWMERNRAVPKACQILVLDSPTGQWKVDHQFESNNLRLVAMKALRFTTDGAGKTIAPAALLVAAPDTTAAAPVLLYSHNDQAGDWVPMTIGRSPTYSTTRAIGFHQDRSTHTDAVFAGNVPLGLIRGTYDAAQPGRIKWEKSPELIVPSTERVMGFCEANGSLCCATTNHIYRRTDGPAPTWRNIYDALAETKGVGIRGLSAVPNPSGSAEVLLFVALDKVRRLDPTNLQETIELDMPAFLTKLWGRPIGFVLAAYNDFFPYTSAESGETVWFFGFESTYPRKYLKDNPGSGLRLFTVEDKQIHYAAQGHFFVRHVKDGNVSYEVGEIDDPHQTPLVAVRTIIQSPFPNDAGAFYFGGFDCNGQPSHDSAWIFRGVLRH